MAYVMTLGLCAGLVVSAQSSANTEGGLVSGTEGSDALAVGPGPSMTDGGGGPDRVTFPGSESNARFEVLADSPPTVVTGTEGPDVIAAGPGQSVIDGRGGLDRVTFPGSASNAHSEVLATGDVRITAADGRAADLRNVEVLIFDDGISYFVHSIRAGNVTLRGTPETPVTPTTTTQPTTTTTQPTTTTTQPTTTTTQPTTTTRPVADCQPKYLWEDRCYEQYFVGVNKSDEMTRHYMVNTVRYESMVLDYFERAGLKNPLHSMATTGQWVIYYHIEGWRGPFGAEAATNMTRQFRDSANDWLATLREYDRSAPSSANIKVFGFVFNEGVEIDPTFYEVYGSYPIVTGWNRTNEESPWLVTDRATGAVFDQNDWGRAQDFNDLRVAGNRTDVASSVRYSPANWAGYSHPENLDMFYTKFWFKNTWDAVAQRQYLKMGGTVEDFRTGTMNAVVLRHEMGHTMFHDDLYDEVKYPSGRPLRFESIMYIAPQMGGFDAVIQRMIWDVVKP